MSSGRPRPRAPAPRSREAVLLELIGLIYAAAEDPTRWDPFLRRLADVFRANLATIIFEDLRSHKARVATNVGIDPALARGYEEYYAGINVWMGPALARFGSGEVMTSEMILPDRLLTPTEYYDGFLRKLDVRHLLATFIFRDTNVLGHLSMARSHRAGEADADERRLFRDLIPHVQRAFQLHRRIVDLKSEREVAAEALDRVPVGLLLLDWKGRALLVNRGAREILAAGDGLSLQTDGLHASLAAETAALRRLISEALQIGSRKGLGSGGALAVSRPSMRRSYSLLVTPLRAERSVFGEPAAIAAVFVSDPERRVESNPEILRRLYGFTPSESRIAVRLLQGQSVEEAAEELEITANTARFHVKHLFEKTGTNRHRELVRLLLLGCAGLAAD